MYPPKGLFFNSTFVVGLVGTLEAGFPQILLSLCKCNGGGSPCFTCKEEHPRNSVAVLKGGFWPLLHLVAFLLHTACSNIQSLELQEPVKNPIGENHGHF